MPRKTKEFYLSDKTLKLRAVEPSDIDFMCGVENDSAQWVQNSMQAPLSRENIANYIKNYNANPFAEGQLRLIAEDSDGVRIGIADLYELSAQNHTAFVGIYVIPSLRRRGIGTAMLESLAKYSHDVLNLRILGAKIASTNLGSLRLFKNSGFKQCGYLENWIQTGYRFFDLLIYTKIL